MGRANSWGSNDTMVCGCSGRVKYNKEMDGLMDAKDKVQKLILYAKHKQNLVEYRQELLDLGIGDLILDKSGDEIAEMIYRSIEKQWKE